MTKADGIASVGFSVARISAGNIRNGGNVPIPAGADALRAPQITGKHRQRREGQAPPLQSGPYPVVGAGLAPPAVLLKTKN